MPVWRAQLGAAVLALGLGSTPIAAQSVNDYRLPGATSTPAPTGAQGPVDASEPTVRQSVASPSPSPLPSPATTQTPPARTAPSPRPAPSSAPTARPSVQAAAPQLQPQPQPSTATPVAPLPEASPAAAPVPTPLPSASAPSSSPLIPETLWPWLAAALALIAASFSALWWRSRKAPPAVVEFERPVPAQAPVPQPASPAPVPPAPAAPAVEIVLEAQRLTASLMATTLTYRLRLTNLGDEALTTLAIEGDMVSAHASLPPDQQIAAPEHRLELRHAAVDLAPGASAEFAGDLRLALTAITPIRAGDGTYFVPLARLRVETSTPAGAALITVQTFVIGELAENPGAPLRPFRLDRGPRTYARLGQRVVD